MKFLVVVLVSVVVVEVGFHSCYGAMLVNSSKVDDYYGIVTV